MSTVTIDTHAPAPAFGLHGATPLRRAAPDQALDHDSRRSAGDPAPAVAGIHAESLPTTGSVYALKDGSGYVTLASDGHYYKLESGPGDLTYASASGPVDASRVDVAHGPARAMHPARGTDDPCADATHLPGSGNRQGPGTDAASAQPRATAGHGGTEHGSVPPHDAPDAHPGLGTAASAADAGKPPADNPPSATASVDAEANARATGNLITQNPAAAVRSHTRVSRRNVVSLLR